MPIIGCKLREEYVPCELKEYYISNYGYHFSSVRTAVIPGKTGEACIVYHPKDPTSLSGWIGQIDFWHVRYKPFKNFWNNENKYVDDSLSFLTEEKAVKFMLDLLENGYGEHGTMYAYEYAMGRKIMRLG